MSHLISLDQVSFSVKAPHDFTWLHDLGNVFVVFAEQDSGNLSFGVEKNDVKKFVKYAGASPLHFAGDPEEAITRLKEAIPVYESLQHPNLVNLVEHFQLENGYALVFEWFEGEGLHPHWKFPPPLKYEHPDSPYFRFRQLSIDHRLAVLKNIFEFHVHVEEMGYVAIDFYDGSILYDFKHHQMKICDIDLYQQKPYTNPMGRLWGSSRFMSPEEFIEEAEIDSRTNVFLMGATAFALVGGELDRSIEKWEASQALYDVAMQASEKERDNRYTSVKQFFQAWEEALRIEKNNEKT
ncbi:protein kinase domain-containing protein [Lederbergia galactosidilytica]|uniref:Serine/threonine protein kinase n=1 Tax=Lederbergia galactosidilytica TaxID=217031 RepID=A0A178A1F2_9BACI|nr:protein kinase [Lederbergia galactosidilytica]MBP1913876.1 serine/threonine-protein kinase [Lederbergia galactosidilytica]OAK73924.1 serine/threonine protein kinase [Lederbergia galactosidilytica]